MVFLLPKSARMSERDQAGGASKAAELWPPMPSDEFAVIRR
jgi:hypothetical protein